MIICICNNITETMVRDNPECISQCGTECGQCRENIQYIIDSEVHPMVKVVDGLDGG